MRLVESYNVSNFVKAAFSTLTSLTVRVPIHTSEQVDYILQFLLKETRRDVKLSLLSDLSQLAGYLPNQWSVSQTHRLCKLFGSNSCISEKEEILAIFFKLTESCNFVDLLLHPDEAITENDGSLDCVASCIQWVALENTQSPANTNSALVPRALSLACKLTVLIHLRGGDRKLTTGRNSVLQSDSVADFISQTMSSRKAVKEEDQDPQDGEPWFLSTMGPSLVELKHMYMNLLRFFRVFPQFAVILRSVGLFEEVVLSSNPRVALLCQFLGFLCESMARSKKEDWLPTVNEILEHFDATPRGVGRCASTDSAPSSTLPAPFVLVFRMARGEPLSVGQRLRLLSCLARATALTEEEEKCLEPWLVYKLACRASLFRQPSLAADIYDQLCSLATTSTSVYWLQGLATLSRSEVNLLTSVSELTTAMKSSPALPWLPRLSAALREASDTAFKARKFFLSTGNRAVNWFQTDYLETRAAFLACLSELCLLLFHAGSSPRCARWAFLETVKSPHVVSSESTPATKNPLIVLQTLLPSWNSLLANLSALIQRCIDADLETLRHLKAFLETVRFFRSTISEFSDNCSSDNSASGTPPWMGERSGVNLDCLDETDGFGSDSLQTLLSEFRAEFANRLSCSPDDSITPAQLLANFAFQVSSSPARLPRFFFKRLQSTSIRLVILPKPNSPSEPLILAQEMGLVLNVMGIVSQKSPRIDLMRRVAAAELVMSISRSSNSPSSSSCEDSSLSSFQQTQRRVVPIQRDYFHTEFCLTFPRPAQPLDLGSQTSAGGSRSSTSTTAELYRVFLEAFLMDANGLRWRLCGTSSEAGVGESILVRVEPRSSAPSADFTQPISSQNAALLKFEVSGDSKTKVSFTT
ncbi:hypothetical protein AAHC03_0751 [Spirometra sp. Aus1]